MKTTKILSLLLAVLLLTLLGCGGDKTAGTTRSGEQSGSVGGSVSTPAPAGKEETPAPAEEETPAPAEAEPLMGGLQNNIYTNEYFSLGCTLDENWRFSTREEIEQSNSQVAELVDDEDVKAMLEDGGSYMDMSAEADGGLVNINASIENVGVLYGLTMDESGYMDAALQNNDFESVYAAMGMGNVSVEKNEVEFAGATHPGARIQGEYEGVTLYQQLVAVKRNSYVMVVTCTCWGEDILPTMLSYFYAL